MLNETIGPVARQLPVRTDNLGLVEKEAVNR
jgi:hypothetical protein